MVWVADISQDQPIIEIQFSGQVSPEELSQAVMKTIGLAKRHGCSRVLADCTQLRGGHTLFDLYDTVQILTEDSEIRAMKFKEAILTPRSVNGARGPRFWEDACVNRGIAVRLFDERQAALDWLIT